MKDKALAVQKNTMPSAITAESLIAQAIDKKIPVETMEKLLTMRRELKAEWSKEEFDKAMANFQKNCPTIQKTKIVHEKGGSAVRYKYAPLDSIVEQVKGLLSENGFSYTMTVVQDEKMLGVTCKATHKAGHSEQTTFSVPIGTEGYMSDVQKYGARLTFAKRYAFCNAFGILTGDEDTDASPTATEKIKAEKVIVLASEKQISFVKNLLKQKGFLEKQLTYKFRVKTLEQLTKDQASLTIEKLSAMPTKSGFEQDMAAQKPEVVESEIDLDEADRAINGKK